MLYCKHQSQSRGIVQVAQEKPAATPAAKSRQSSSFKRALDANLDGIPNSPGIRKAIAKRAGDAIPAAGKGSTTSIEGEVVRVGRPSKYSLELGLQICELIADGKTLREIEAIEGMPGKDTIRRWLRDHDEFQAHYARAREDQADAFADDIIIEANKASRGEVDPLGARVKIDAYKWAAAKRKPKVYGDKVDLTSDGKQLPAPLFGGTSVALPEGNDE